jgi:AcrR family transcriptional regulator
MERKRTGRRPGPSTTREAILTAAQESFEQVGYTATSLRAIAREARVDPALIRKFFGDKQRLFLAVAQVTFDPRRLATRLAECGPDSLGPRLVATALKVWESPAGTGLVRAVNGSPKLAAGLAGDLAHAILTAAETTLPGNEEERRLRVALVEIQLAGLFMTRYLLHIEPIASLDRETVAVNLGPLIQHLLTGQLHARAAPG